MKIEDISVAEKDAAVEVLRRSFYDYPVMRYTLKDTDEADYDDQVGALIGFFADARFMRGNPVLGIRDEGIWPRFCWATVRRPSPGLHSWSPSIRLSGKNWARRHGLVWKPSRKLPAASSPRRSTTTSG